VRAASGPLVLLAALVGGLIVGERAAPVAATGFLVVGVSVGVVAIVVGMQRDQLRSALALGVVALVMVGTTSMQRARHGLVSSPLAEAVAGYEPATIVVTLTEDPGGPTRFAVDATGRVHGAHRSVLVVATGDAAGRTRVLSAGDQVTLVGSFRPLNGWERRARWRHAVGAFVATDLVDVAPPSSPLFAVANQLRGLVVAGTARAPATERALLAGLLLGDTRAIPSEMEEAFRSSGLTHHLAVSGENVAFVLVLAGPLLRRFGYRGRFLGGLVVIVVFGTMTRWEPSVLRAVTMTGCVMLAGLVGRPASGLRVLTIAAGGLLVADPFLIHSVGFGLSCAATAGIALFAEPISRRLRGPTLVGEALAVTLAAQIGVAPIMIPVFGSMPLASLPANVIAAPLMAPITIGGLVAGIGGGLVAPVAPGAARALVVPVTVLVRALEGAAVGCARIPFELGGVAAALAAAGGLGAAGGRLAWRRSRRNGPTAGWPGSSSVGSKGDGDGGAGAGSDGDLGTASPRR